jgi:TonB family protein
MAMGSRVARPTWEIPVALAGHGLAAAILIVAEMWAADTAPLINPDEVMIAVATAALPRSTSRMPEKAQRAPDPPKGVPDEVAPPPPPPTASDMVIPDKEAPKAKGAEKPKPTNDKKREELLRKQRREALLRDASAEVGTEDRVATDPNGVDPKDAVLGAGAALGDPELGRYIEELRSAVLPHWTPLPSTVQAHPDYAVIVGVRVSESGALSSPRVVQGSGDASFDRAAVLALTKTGRVPPPPAKYRDSAARGIQFRLYAKDK